MTPKEIAEAVGLLADKLGVPVQGIIKHYATWFIAASIGWMIAGILICIMSIWMGKKMWNWPDAKEECDVSSWHIAGFIIGCVGFIIGLLIFFGNLGDLIAPSAAGIHQIIIDLRG